MAEAPFTVKTSPYLKWAVYVVISILIYLGVSYVIPHLTSYDVKTALKMACVTYVRETRSSAYDATNPRYEAEFIGAMRKIGLPLAPEQYAFELSEESDSVVCTGKAAFKLHTSWPLLQPVLGKDYKFTTTHRPVHVYKWRRQF